MNVNPTTSYNVSMQGGGFDRLKKAIWNSIPNKTASIFDKQSSQKIIDTFSNPTTNKIIIGSTALVTQPLFDYYNKDVDKETRKISTYRTIAKILAGTAVGIAVRGTCFKLVTKFTNPEAVQRKFRKLIPTKYLLELHHSSSKLSNYQNALSTLIAIGVMCFTNFLLDAPLTMYLTKVFTSADKKAKAKEVDNAKTP